MNTEELALVLGSQPEGRMLYPYFKDRYALDLLARFVGDGKHKREVAASHFGRLLQKPILRSYLERYGDGVLSRDRLLSVWPAQQECYRLTLSKWGNNNRSWDQVSRRGGSLVLQVNFSHKHDRIYEKFFVRPEFKPFVAFDHPVNADSLNSLSWARIDVHLEHGVALVEEIQSDWVRSALATYRAAMRWFETRGKVFDYCLQRLWAHKIHPQSVVTYFHTALKPHLRGWSELTLSATLHYLAEELGVSDVWLHTPESGAFLKRMSLNDPPRSLYTKLPKSFCFQATSDWPDFIRDEAERDLRVRRRRSGPKPKVLELQRQFQQLKFWRLRLGI